MWVYTRRRHEHDPRFVINLDHYPSIAINKLGERYFVDAGTGGDTTTLASTDTEEEATKFVQQIFDALEAGKTALNLEGDDAPPPEDKSDHASHPEPLQATPPQAITR